MNAGIEVVVDGTPVAAAPDETIAGLLLRLGIGSWRGGHRMFCGIGTCWDCTLTVDGRPHVRACISTVRPRMAVDTGRGLR